MENQDGGVLVFVLVIMMASLVIAVTWSSFAHITFKKTIDQEGEERAFQAAEGGIDYVMSLVTGGGCSLGGLDGQVIVGSIDNATFQAEVNGATIDATGWYGSQCQRVSGELGSFWGLMGGPFYYKTGISHDVSWHGPCGDPPTGGGYTCAPEYAEAFDDECGALDDYGDGSQWTLVTGNQLNVDCDDFGVEMSGCSGGSLYKAENTDTTANSIVSVTQVSGGNTGALAVRIQDDDNSRYELVWDEAIGALLCKYVGEVVDSCSASSGYLEIPDGSVISLRAIGNHISGMVDGTVVVDYLDDGTISAEPPILDAGNAGLGVGLRSGACYNGGLYDDFQVVPL